MEGTHVKARQAPTGMSRFPRAKASGQFRLDSLPPCDYQVEISTPAETLSQKLNLQPRDRVTFAVFLRKEPAGAVVAANEVNWIIDAELDVNGNVVGFGQGIGRGFGGGIGAGHGAVLRAGEDRMGFRQAMAE